MAFSCRLIAAGNSALGPQASSLLADYSGTPGSGRVRHRGPKQPTYWFPLGWPSISSQSGLLRKFAACAVRWWRY